MREFTFVEVKEKVISVFVKLKDKAIFLTIFFSRKAQFKRL